MNFFKSVFADDTTPPDSPKSQSPPDHSNPEDPNPTTQNPTWSFGSLIQTLAAKSESVIEVYKKDLEEFGSGLKKETSIIRDVASRAVHDLPASFEARAAVAQEAIDGIGSTVWKSTAEIISQGKDSILAADHDHDHDLLSSNADGSRSSMSKQQSLDVKYSRFDAQVHALQSDLDTYCSEPEDKEDYEKWKLGGFVIDEKKEEIDRLIAENGVIREIYNEVVPSRVDNESFWSRFFYRMFKLKQAEEARALLVKRAISGDEDDLSWDFDDDKEEGDGFLSKGESTKNVQGEKEKNADERIDENAAEKEKVGVSEDKLGDGFLSKGESTKNAQGEKEKNADERIDENSAEKEKVGVDRSEDKLEEKVVVVVEGKSSTVESCKDNDKLEEKAVVVKGEGGDGKSGKDGDKLKEKVVEVVEGKGDNGESCKDSDVSVVSSQMLPEEDLEWDEIEDIGSNDESKGEAVGSRKSASASKVDLHKRLSAAEEEDDFSWDIEDEDDVHVK